MLAAVSHTRVLASSTPALLGRGAHPDHPRGLRRRSGQCRRRRVCGVSPHPPVAHVLRIRRVQSASLQEPMLPHEQSEVG